MAADVYAENGAWRCLAQANEELFLAVFYSIAPDNVPEARRPAMAEFLTRANYGLPVGNFETDFADGEVRFKTSADLEGVRFDPALIRQLVYANVTTFDRYLRGLEAVVAGVSPADAIAIVEGE